MEGARPETTRPAPECAQTPAQTLETWCGCANKRINEWIEDKGMCFRMPFPEVIGSPGTPPPRPRGGGGGGVQYPAHSFTGVSDTKAIPHVKSRLLPPSSTLRSGFQGPLHL